MEINEIIKIENYGRKTKLSIAGVDISKGITGVSFRHDATNIGDPSMILEIDIKLILECLSKISTKDLAKAGETIKMYLDGYKKAADDSGSDSVVILR